jgi:hypothetical protein
MKKLKLSSGIIIILAFLLLIPKVSCSSYTVFLNMGQMAGPYILQVSEEDKIRWSYQTYNDSFTVSAYCTGVAVMTSTGTSDSGTVKAIITGGVIFAFMNIGSTSGYIDINIRVVKERAIKGYHLIIFIITIISIISIISIRKMRIKKNYSEIQS